MSLCTSSMIFDETEMVVSLAYTGPFQGAGHVTDVDQEQQWTKTRTLRNSTIYFLNIGRGAIYPAKYTNLISAASLSCRGLGRVFG